MIDISHILMMNTFSKLDFTNGIFTYEIFSILIILYLVNIFKVKLNDYTFDYFDYVIRYIKPKYASIEIIGWETLNDDSYCFDYPDNMTAINYYIYKTNKSNNFKYFNIKKNGNYFIDTGDITTDNNSPNYIMKDTTDIYINDDIYISVYTKNIDTGGSTPNQSKTLNWRITMTIKTYKYNTSHIQKFINDCIYEYEKYIRNKNRDKTYHFIYQGKTSNKLNFSSTLISDFNNPTYQNFETFDNIFHSNKQMIMNDIDRLKDIEYYKKTGFKRKKGYLFFGEPGTGKTATVMAMSNYDKRHIIEVPMGRVKTNNELEQIISIDEINNIKFNPNNIIILFDELDIDTNLTRSNKNDIMENITDNDDSDNENNENNKNNKNNKLSKNQYSEPNDKLSLATLLSRFDGIGNYGGLILVATSNNINKIDKAIYRDGRLSLIKYENATTDDIKNIIEKYYNITLTETQQNNIKQLNMKLSHANLRFKLENYDDPDKLIEYLDTNYNKL